MIKMRVNKKATFTKLYLVYHILYLAKVNETCTFLKDKKMLLYIRDFEGGLNSFTLFV